MLIWSEFEPISLCIAVYSVNHSLTTLGKTFLHKLSFSLIPTCPRRQRSGCFWLAVEIYLSVQKTQLMGKHRRG